jgi:hypothetical protein
MTLSLLSLRATQHDLLQLLFIMESSWRSMCLNQPLKNIFANHENSIDI